MTGLKDIIVPPNPQPGMPLIHALPRSVYLAEGGELPKHERHFLMHQEKYRKIAACVLRTLAFAAEQTQTDEGAAHAAELRDIARETEETQG